MSRQSLSQTGMAPQHQFREVHRNEEEARVIWKWRNDPATRAASFDSGVTEWPQFWQDFNRRQQQTDVPTPRILESDGSPVAYVSFHIPRVTDQGPLSSIEISINVSPIRRRSGFGRLALLEAEQFLKDAGYRRILAFVKIENSVSHRLFECAGYRNEKDRWVPATARRQTFHVTQFARTIP